MDASMNLLEKTALFSGMKGNEIDSILKCLSAHTVRCKKEQFIVRRGNQIRQIGMVLSGSVLVIREDFWGNRSILSEVPAGFIFAESYACLDAEPLGVSVTAASDCEILFLDFKKLLTVCSGACDFHTRLIHNLISVLAGKNRTLTKKLEHMSQKNTRDKLLSYLSSESLQAGSAAFSIPFNRQQLADYLSVNRSALSEELGKLQKDGILEFHKNKFILKDTFQNLDR